MKDKISGWVQLILAGLSTFLQIYGASHGVTPDVGHLAVTAAIATNGIHHVSGKKT